jgi:hypothetical protein
MDFSFNFFEAQKIKHLLEWFTQDPTHTKNNLLLTFKPSLEPLEERLAPSYSISWDGGGNDNNFLNPLNWDLDRLPNSTDDVLIRVGNTLATVSLNTGNSPLTVRSLVSDEVLLIEGEIVAPQGVTLNQHFTLFESSHFKVGTNTPITFNQGMDAYGGTFDVAQGATAKFNSGIFLIDAGSGTIQGTFHISENVNVRFEGAYTFQDGSSITGPGQFSSFGGTITINGGVNINNLMLHSYSYLNGTGTANISGNLD